jgi:hypothetical protein
MMLTLRSTSAHTSAATPGSGANPVPLNKCIDILREQLGIEAVAMHAVVEEALAMLADDAITAHCNILKSLLLKAQPVSC